MKRFQSLMLLFIILNLCFISSCNSGDDDDDSWSPPPIGEDITRDIVNTSLSIDVSSLTGQALVTLAPSADTGASLEVGGLQVDKVYCEEGDLNFVVTEGRLDIGVPISTTETTVTVDYSFSIQSNFNGYLESGMTLIWPYYCGNLFPCHSEPFDGTTFQLTIGGIPAGMEAIYPTQIGSSAPSYQIAWALGDYEYRFLGMTDGGTEVGCWFLPGGEANALQGCSDLPEIVDWYEKTLGPYPFGPRMGTVSVDWPAGAYGGMEHHPYWHVAKGSMKRSSTQFHEAAHGWYGDGIRIECWEDFVLSEGTVSYLTARATGQVLGQEAESAIWSNYEQNLNYILNGHDGIAWPDSCGEVDILEDGLFSQVPYMKGAYFYKAVAEQIGERQLDQVLSSFFSHYAGQAAGMQDMLDHILAETGFDPSDLADGWLRQLGVPDTFKPSFNEHVLLRKNIRGDRKAPFPLDFKTELLWAQD